MTIPAIPAGQAPKGAVMKRLALLAAAVATAFALPACASGAGSLARITVIDRTANR